MIPRRKAQSGKRPTVLTYYKEEQEPRWLWSKHPEKLSQEDQNRVMAEVIRIMINTTFDHHYYKWGGRIKRQIKGGAIGLRATGSLACLLMDIWIQEFGDILKRNGVEIHLLKSM